eukprot:SM000075S21969  [mRNA]  locus=s75:352291:354407:+ [translate_table: standard]
MLCLWMLQERRLSWQVQQQNRLHSHFVFSPTDPSNYVNYYVPSPTILHPFPQGDACNIYTCDGDFRGGKCETVRIHHDGTFCDVNTANATAIDPRCQINACSNGQCTTVVSKKPVGSVCHPSFLDVDHYFDFYDTGGSCISNECCAQCDAAGRCDDNIRDGMSCTKCTEGYCSEGPGGCEPDGWFVKADFYPQVEEAYLKGHAEG